MTFVYGTPGSIDPKGTPGDIDPQGSPGDGYVHDQLPSFVIDTSDSDTNQTKLPPRGWTIFIDNSILVLPFSDALRDGEPALGMTRLGDAVIPTVSWAHAVGIDNHDPVIARYVNDAWTPAETISASLLDDRDPSFAQDESRTMHAVWGRDDGNGTHEVFYVNQPERSTTFSPEEHVSRIGESALNSSLAVLASGDVFVAYESERGTEASLVIVARRTERRRGEGSTFRHRVMGHSSANTPAAPEVVPRSDDELLLTWMASASRVGFSVFAKGRWSVPGYEPAGPMETVAETRGRLVSRFTSTLDANPASNR